MAKALPAIRHRVSADRYFGKVCVEHPELKGERSAKRGRCVGCHRAEQKRRRSTPEGLKYMALRVRKTGLALKQRVMDAYGGRCRECKITDIDMLTIDHKNNDGAKHRLSLNILRGVRGSGSRAVYRWLERHNFPPGFQVLCFNHNIKKHLLLLRKRPYAARV